MYCIYSSMATTVQSFFQYKENLSNFCPKDMKKGLREMSLFKMKV